MNVDKTLQERGERYGEFPQHAHYTQHMKTLFKTSPNWINMSPAKKESLEMIAHKIGRILNGDPDYADSWHDIAGYAKLVEDELNAD